MKISFDEHGHLFPYQLIQLTIEDFEKTFVIERNSTQIRAVMFEELLRFLTIIKDFLKRDFIVWIDGSFITTKEFPSDIDLIVMADYDQLLEYRERLSDILKHYRQSFKKLDFYFIPVCKPDHHYYSKSLALKAYWQNLFTFSKENKALKRLPKGLVQINL